MKWTFAPLDEEALSNLGRKLSTYVKEGVVFSLSGKLGSGKTTLARAIIRNACNNVGDIPSPTFNLVQSYEVVAGFEIWHLDLYRIESPEDAMQLGLDDAFVDAVCLIEWPDRLEKFLPKSALSVHLCQADGDDLDDAVGIRFAKITAPPRWADRLKAIIVKSSST